MLRAASIRVPITVAVVNIIRKTQEKTHQSKDLNLARNINSDGVTRRMRKMQKCLCEAAVPLLQKTRQKPEEKEAVRPWPVH